MAVVTVLGVDRVGIVAGVSGVLATHQANIVDISMTVMGDIFSMIMYVDVSPVADDMRPLNDALQAEAQRLGVQIMCQKEEVFRYAHRI